MSGQRIWWLELWKRYCTDLYDTENLRIQDKECSPDEPDILRAEVKKTIDLLKCGKTPSRDGISAEMIKNVRYNEITAITDICNAIWRTGTWPENWTESVFILLKGSMKECSNYQTMALISHASKVLLHVINSRLPLSHATNTRGTGRLLKGKGTRELILNVRQIIEKSREFNSPVKFCFIDYKAKASDCVQWSHLWSILIEMGVPRHLVYATNRCLVK